MSMLTRLVPITIILLVVFPEIRSREFYEDPSSQMSNRYFTVRDSIEMARFGRVDYEPKFSPDGKYFVVVTSRGVIEKNEVESTLWVFATDAVRQSSAAKTPAPKVVARLAAIPKRAFDVAYGSIISDVKWMPDSKGVLFLAQNSSANRQLYRADVNAGFAKALTPPDQDVSQFDFAGGTIAYRVTQIEGKSGGGYPINADARGITQMDISAILFPNSRTASFPASFRSALWVSRNLRNRPVIDSTTGQPLGLWDLPPASWSALSVSPDGKSVVALLPVKEVRQSWERYEPKYAYNGKIKIHDPSRTAGSDSPTRRLTQYAVIDLTTGKNRALMDAPNGWALGYGDPNRATWSSDGKQVLLINTFLPFEGADESEKAKRVRACAAAVVDVNSMISRCVSYGHEAHVWGSSFGQTDDDVVLRFGTDLVEEKFHLQGDSWQPEVPLASPDKSLPSACTGLRQNVSGGLLIEVAQDLNDPPVLSAADCATGRRRKLWDPNPQLADIKRGEASIIKWKDATGYEWQGALLKPADHVPGKRYPLVIQTYGFVEKEFLTDGQDTTAFAAGPLAASGVAVLLFWHRVDAHVTEEEQLLGFESAIEHLSSEGLIDANRVGIIGFSQTSYRVESALIKYQRRFAAATIASGVDFSYLQYFLFPGANQLFDEINGARPFGEGLKTWFDHAPGFQFNRIQTPVRIEAVDGPSGVLVHWELYASLSKQNKPVDLVYIPEGQHILQKPLDRMASQQGDVDWFRFWLQGYEDPDPAKAEQYARWRELRKLQESEATRIRPQQ